MKKLARAIVKMRRLILIAAVLLLIPAAVGAVATPINYDILSYLPQELDSRVGQLLLEPDYHLASTNMITVEGMPTNELLAMKAEIDEVPDDVFTMTGRINRIKATLTRATEAEMQAVKQGQLQEALRNAPSYKQNLFCYMDVNGLTVDVKLSTRTVMFLYKVGNVTQIEAVETHTDIVTKDLVFDTPVTINGVEIKGLNYHADTDNFTTDSDTPILIQAKSKANIGMEACFGVEKYYTILRVEDGMFPSTNESENYLGYLMHNIFQMKLLLTSGIASFSHINLYFGLDTEGNSQLTVAPVIGGIGQEVRYTYQITFNQAEDSFTIDGSTLSMDSNAESFNDGSIYNLTEFLKNKTFKIEWTNVAYDVYTMGQLRATNSSQTAVIYGALTQE